MLSEDFLKSWEYVHPRDLFESIDAPPQGNRGVRWTIYNELKPVDLFCYLGARFGRPNGIQNFLRSDDSDNLIHWEWTLKTDIGQINFMGMNFRTEIWLQGGSTLDAADRDVLIELIRGDLRNFGPGMKKIRGMLESWVEFVNPYQRLRRAVEELRAQLQSLELELTTAVQLDPSSDNFDVQRKVWEDVSTRFSQGTGLCFGIRSMLPVMAEAFVNMLLYLLMRPEIRIDDRLRENAVRQPIDIRVKSLSITCIGFARPVDYTTDVCKRYHSLVNERNDLLHGNVVIEKLKFNELYFWHRVPVFKQYRSMWERSIGVEIQAVGLDKVADEVTVVEEFTAYLLSCLQEDTRSEVEYVLGQRDLGFRTETGRVGVLFSGWLVDFHPVFGKGEVDPRMESPEGT